MKTVTIKINLHDFEAAEQFINSKKGLINTIKHAVGHTPDKSIRGSLEMLEKLEFTPESINV